MNEIIVVAGATGNLGGRIVKALVREGADVRALIRPGADEKKVATLREKGAEVFTDSAEAMQGAACVVSALQGLPDVIVEAQSELLVAALGAGVPRFIPSDYSTDFTDLPVGENRNFDLRREFHQVIDASDIQRTSIYNGAFAEILTYGIPLFDFRKHTITYWEDADRKLDFTTMDDTATFTAKATMDHLTPEKLCIAGFQVSARELADAGESVLGPKFELIDGGSLEQLSVQNKRLRAEDPDGESEVFPKWQQSQYVYSMFKAPMVGLDNDRYSGLEWTSLEQVLRWVRAESSQDRN